MRKLISGDVCAQCNRGQVCSFVEWFSWSCHLVCLSILGKYRSVEGVDNNAFFQLVVELCDLGLKCGCLLVDAAGW